MLANIPPEIYREIFSYLRRDSATLKAVRESSMAFALLSQAFSHLVFKHADDILEFFDIASAPHSTIPEALHCDSVCFKKTVVVVDADLTDVSEQLARIRLNYSLAIHCIAEGGIPPAVIQVSGAWRHNIRQLSICGGTHSPAAFFGCLALFPLLRSLALKDFHVGEEAGTIGRPYKFPATVAQLSLSHCATLWTFLGSQVQPSGGLGGVQDLYIQELFFNGEDGIPQMRACLRGLHSVHTLTLDPVYHDRYPNFNCPPYDVYRKSWEATLLQMQGLKLLRVNCASLPQKTATESVCMYALQFADPTKSNTVVEIYAPHSLDLSRPGACEELLDATNLPLNSTAATGPGGSNLVIRGLPGRLPRAMDASQRVMVCEYPVAFKETDWDEAMGSRLDGL